MGGGLDVFMSRAGVLTLGLVFMLTALPVPAGAQAIQVIVDGRVVAFDQPPRAIGGRVLVPLRGVFEYLGAFVQWDPRTNTVIADRAGTQIVLVIGSRQATVNNRPISLDVPPLLIGGRTLVPLRFVSEALGASVDWDPATRTVFISSAAARPPRPAPVPSPLQVAVVEGTVLRVEAQAVPPRIVVQHDGVPQAFFVTATTTITQVDVDTNQRETIDLLEIRPGDLVRVTADAAGRAILIRVSVREVTGRVDLVTSQAIILADGRAFTLGDEVRFFLDGREVSRRQVQERMEVTLRVNPQTQEVVEVRARLVVRPPLPSLEPVRIVSLTHDAPRPLRAGEVLTVTLRGTPGGVATFDLFGVVTHAAMREIAPGLYQGTYAVRTGGNVVNAALFGHLRVGAREAPIVQAAAGVTVDTLPPLVTRRLPEPTSTVTTDRPNILILFTDRGGSGIDTNATRLFVADDDVTGRATITDTTAAFTARQALSGRVSVRLVLWDRAGNRTDDRYSFTVAPPSSPLINSVTVQPSTPLRAGDVVTVTVVGTPRGRAVFTIEGVVQAVPMAEASGQPGVYIGTYTIRSNDAARNARVIVQLRRGGRVGTAEATVQVTIATAVVARPTITAPTAGERVGVPLTIRGTALPGSQVVVRVDFRPTGAKGVNLRGTYGEVAATVDQAGKWQVVINQAVRIRGAELTITARAVDAAGRTSEPVVVIVTQR